MASRLSVTVSMAAESSGMLSAMWRVKWVFRFTFFGRTRECAGTSNTSSKVRASLEIRMGMDIWAQGDEVLPHYRV